MTSDEVGLTSAPGGEARWTGFLGVERAIVRTLVSELLDDRSAALSPAEMFTAVCEVMESHLSLTSASFFKRIAGQSRTLEWSAPGVPAASRMAAREHAWKSAATVLDGSPLQVDNEAASVAVADERLGLSAQLYVESCRALDDSDRALIEEVLRRMVCLPSAEELRRGQSLDG